MPFLDKTGLAHLWNKIVAKLSGYETTANAQSKLDEAKLYADSAATTAANAVKNDLLNGAGTAYDTLKELGDLIDENQDAITALETVASGKADAEHTHDDLYYTESEIDAKINELSGSIADITSGSAVVAKAENANHATSADSADEATHAESADTATSAEHATIADSATSCTGNAATATKATQDADGNVIIDTYETKDDAEAKLVAAKEYTDDAIAAIPQADWNQGDNSQADYIKNKPKEVSEDEFLAWLNEERIVEPVTTNSGELYTTNNNEIYVL